MKFLVINGPNLNMLGVREPEVYGRKTYKDLVKFIHAEAKELGIKVKVWQSNSESRIVSKIQKSYKKFDGIIINPAAFTHTSIAILDALKSVSLPFVEVHISDVQKREDFRQVSYIRPYAYKTIMGQGFDGYKIAITLLASHLCQRA